MFWRFALGCLLLALTLPLASCSSGGGEGDDDKPTYGFVTNTVADFWVIGEAGARQAAEDLDVNVVVRMPAGQDTGTQQRMIRELLSQNVDGVAISPIDPTNQADMLREIADRTNLITHDSDAPDSPRQVYIGVNNRDAGRMCAELVKQALPEGGSVVIFVGNMEQLNAQQRRQGLIDELLGREENSPEFDPQNEKLVGDKYTILGTYTDGNDATNAKTKTQQAVSTHPDADCMVGLFEYNPPVILDVLREAGKLDEVAVIGFDENEQTLAGIRKGEVVGTVVQDPYMYGYRSIETLHKLHQGDKSVIPPSGVIKVPAKKITKENVDAFEKELNERKGKTKEAA